MNEDNVQNLNYLKNYQFLLSNFKSGLVISNKTKSSVKSGYYLNEACKGGKYTTVPEIKRAKRY